MFCQNCGKENANDAAFCNSCGAALKGPVPQTVQSTCNLCGNPVNPGENICSKCSALLSGTGATSTETPPTPQEKHGLLFWCGILLVVILIIIFGSGIIASFFLTNSGGASIHNPGEKFVVTLPGANGGSTQAEIIMLGSYESNGGENNMGYSWYYTITIKNIGDTGIDLPMSESAEDNSGITANIDQIYNGLYIELHPGEEGDTLGGPTISNKIYLLQSQQNPMGGGMYHLNLGGTIINFKIPETATPLVLAPIPTTTMTPNPTTTQTGWVYNQSSGGYVQVTTSPVSTNSGT